MLNPRGQITAGLIILSLSLSVSLFFILSSLPLKYSFILIISCVLCFLAFINTDLALIVLIFSMLLSPELKVGSIPGREIMIRADDIFLFFIFFGWMAKLAINKELGLFKNTPVNMPILVYAFVCVITTLLGALRGYVKPGVGIFYILKYMEYFLIFFMVVNLVREIKKARLFIFFILFVGFLISGYACLQHFMGVERATAPFEGIAGEANTLGGYLIIIITTATGLFLNYPSVRLRLFLSILLTLAFPALIFTLSRGSWISFVPALIALIIFTRKGKATLLVFSFILILFSPIILPKYFYERIEYTFSYGKKYNILGKEIRLEDSAAARIKMMKYALGKWQREPFFGYGIGGSMPIIDSQIARILLEGGLSGFLAFVWLIYRLFTTAFRNMVRLREDNFGQGLISGFLAGLVGLLIHSLSAETFIIIRIMEPFWFLAAIVIVLPEFQRGHLS